MVSMEPVSEEPSKSGMTLDQMIARGSLFTERNGLFLVACDIVNARLHAGFESRQALQDYFVAALEAATKRFAEYFPENTLRNGFTKDRGLLCLYGDSAVGGMNDSSVVPELVRFFREECPLIKLRWAVAEDGWDREALAIVR